MFYGKVIIYLSTVFILFSQSVLAEKQYYTLEMVAAEQRASSSTGQINGCSAAAGFMMDGIAASVSMIPGVGSVAGFVMSLGSITRNIACTKNGVDTSVLKHMAEISTAIAKEQIDKKLIQLIDNKANVLLYQFKSDLAAAEKFDTLSEIKKSEIRSSFFETGKNSELIESEAKALSHLASSPAMVISMVKLSSFSMYRKMGGTRDIELERRANDTVVIMEGYEKKLNNHIGAYNLSFEKECRDHTVDIFTYTYYSIQGFIKHNNIVKNTFDRKSGRPMGASNGNCRRYTDGYENKIRNDHAADLKAQRDDIITKAFIDVKADYKQQAARVKSASSHSLIASLGGGGYCMDAQASQNNGTRVSKQWCNLRNPNQMWIMDGVGRIRSAMNFDKCVEAGKTPVSGSVLFKWDCHNGSWQKFERHSNNSIRLTNTNLCIATNSSHNLELSDCVGFSSQSWSFYSTLKSRVNKCVVYDFDRATNTKKLEMNKCNIYDISHFWDLDTSGNMRHHKYRSECLIPTDLYSGAPVGIGLCSANLQTQQWKRFADETIRPVSDPNICLDVTTTQKLIVSLCNSKDTQKWY